MLRWPALIILSMLFMSAQASFFSALPAPFNGIDLGLIAVIGLVASFRPRHALIAAAAGGLARDLVTAAPIGLNLLLAAAVTWLLIALFDRVVTNLSLISFAALNAAGFVSFAALAAVTGRPAFGAYHFIQALLLQLAAGVTLLLAARLAGRYLRRRFLYADHAR